MVRRRQVNPWPAFVDLYVALFLVSIAGFSFLGTAIRGVSADLEDCRSSQQQYDRLQAEVARIMKDVQRALEHADLAPRIRECGAETCLDFYVHFDRNDSKLRRPTEIESLSELCFALKSGLEALNPNDKKVVTLMIEGHSDRSQPVGLENPEEHFSFNWNLSAARATSVLYQFATCGIAPPEINVMASGLADSQPICSEPTADCENDNRRTTLRIGINSIMLDSLLRRSRTSEE